MHEEKRTVSVVMPLWLVARLESLARRHTRSRSQEVVHLLRSAVAEDRDGSDGQGDQDAA